MDRRTFMAMAGAGAAIPSLAEAEPLSGLAYWARAGDPSDPETICTPADIFRRCLIERINACPGWWAVAENHGYSKATCRPITVCDGIHIYWTGDQNTEAWIVYQNGFVSLETRQPGSPNVAIHLTFKIHGGMTDDSPNQD